MRHLTLEQLAALKSEMAGIERFPIGGEHEAKARRLIGHLPTVALAQIVAVRVRFYDTFALTELRKRGEVSREAQIIHAIDKILDNAPAAPRLLTNEGKA